MNKFRLYAYSCLAALLFLKVYTVFFVSYGSLPFETRGGNAFILALFLGVMFGLVGCPFCGLPVGLAIVSGDSRYFAAFLKNAVFHLYSSVCT